MTNRYDVIVIGGGAAGLMCAIEAGKRGRSVLVIEHADSCGKKILISGGGRCNFTNIHTTSANFISENPEFCKSALARFTPDDFLALVKAHSIQYYEKTLGQLFCKGSSREILELLLAECRSARVRVEVNCTVQEIGNGTPWRVLTSGGKYEATSVVMATGGLSIPKLGATSFAYDIARRFGLEVVTPEPALVPLTWDEKDKTTFAELSGNSFMAHVRCGNNEFREKLLFTHRGLSGPSILQISSYWSPGLDITVDMFPERDILAELLGEKTQGRKIELKNFLARLISKRIAETFCANYFTNKALVEYSKDELSRIAAQLHDWRVRPNGTEGFQKAEVTRGGVDTREISSKTFESKKAPGLYFIGEALDVTGHLGGFNFQWAWASGYCAGQVV